MFCSRCGKTLNPELESCPHCGLAMGDSRMTGHTSVQARYLPREQKQPAQKYTPYTKTTYTSMGDTGEDVYSRTSYRPVLAVDNAPEDEAMDDEQARADDAAAGDAQPTEAAPDGDMPIPGLKLTGAEADPRQKASIEKLTQVPHDAPDPEVAQQILEKELDIKVEPLKPIRKAGISPEVEGYIKRMDSLKNRGRKRSDEDDGEQAGDEAAPVEGEMPIDESDEKAVKKAEKERAKALRAANPARKWVKRIAAVAAIAVLIVGGFVYLALTTQPKSPIEGVSKQLYDDGLALIKANSAPAYRDKIVELARTDTTFASLQAQQQADADAIAALKADAPLEHDQQFIDALVLIQDSIATASTNEAFAKLDPDQQSAADMQAIADEQWGAVENAVARLENATAILDLNAVNQGLTDTIYATPEPEVTPPPAEYKTIKRKDKGQHVKDLQTRLSELGWFTGVKDGIYGTYSQTAVKYFQQAAGLEVTGIADAETQRVLYSNAAPTYTAGAAVGDAPQTVTSGVDDATPTDQGTDGGQGDDAIK